MGNEKMLGHVHHIIDRDIRSYSPVVKFWPGCEIHERICCTTSLATLSTHSPTTTIDQQQNKRSEIPTTILMT